MPKANEKQSRINCLREQATHHAWSGGMRNGFSKLMAVPILPLVHFFDCTLPSVLVKNHPHVDSRRVQLAADLEKAAGV